jgi:dTDP-4-dehydrorhamnose reductase
MKSVLVIGANGMLGYAVTQYYTRKNYTVTALTRTEFDIARDPVEKLEPFMTGKQMVMNCAGVIKPLIATTPIEDVLKVNTIFPRNLAKLAERLGVHCYHVTTDCAYSGKRGEYTETDVFDADDVYGMSKNGGDNTDCMVLRTSIIGEEKGQSRSLLEWARSNAGKDVNGFTNHRWNGVTTLYLAEVIETIETDGLYQKGIFHVHSPNTLNKFELLTQISDVYQLNLKITPIDTLHPVYRNLASVNPLTNRVAVKTIHQQLKDMKTFFST